MFVAGDLQVISQLARNICALHENNRRARFYDLTAAGTKQLVTERRAWERFQTALRLILESD